MLNNEFLEENAIPFLCGIGATLLMAGLYKISKYCCC